MFNNDPIIKSEIDSLVADLIDAYEKSGKKVSGAWGEGLEAIYSPNKAQLYGYEYLAGRKETKKGHEEGTPYLVESILKWIKARGITPREENMTTTSLAWAIATKIHQEGTNKTYHLNIYEQVITPQRIQSIIDKVSQFNVGMFVNDITVEFNKLSKV